MSGRFCFCGLFLAAGGDPDDDVDDPDPALLLRGRGGGSELGGFGDGVNSFADEALPLDVLHVESESVSEVKSLSCPGLSGDGGESGSESADQSSSSFFVSSASICSSSSSSSSSCEGRRPRFISM